MNQKQANYARSFSTVLGEFKPLERIVLCHRLALNDHRRRLAEYAQYVL